MNNTILGKHVYNVDEGDYIDIKIEPEQNRVINSSFSDCKGRALRKVQEKNSARVKGEAPQPVKGATIAQLVAFRH